MRVVLYDPVVGGHHVEYTSYIIRYLVEQGDEVTFVTWKPHPLLQPLLTTGMPVIIEYVVRDSNARFGGNTFSRFRQASKGIKHCFELATVQQADIVHHLYLERSELSLYLRMVGAGHHSWKLFATLFWPYFIHNHDENVMFPKRIYHMVNRRSLRRLIERKKLNGLFVHSDRIKQELVRSCGNASLEQHIFVVPDPVSHVNEIPRDIARERLGLPQVNPLILFFGGLRWDKGVDILLDALPLIENDFYVVVAGEPDKFGEAEVERCRQRLRHPERLIAHLNHIPDEDVDYYFAAADAVVLPYRRAFRGTSGILQHAAAASKPVIAANAGEVGPAVQQNRLGIIVEPESPGALAKGIQEFLERHQEMTEQVKPYALRYCEANHWRIMASRVREVYLSE